MQSHDADIVIDMISFELEGTQQLVHRAEEAEGKFGSRIANLTVHENLFDGLPDRMRPVGCRSTTTDVYNLVSTLNKCRHEVGSDMSTPSDDDDPSHSFLYAFQVSILEIALTCTPRHSEGGNETIL
jgi:hypothetical protein